MLQVFNNLVSDDGKNYTLLSNSNPTKAELDTGYPLPDRKKIYSLLIQHPGTCPVEQGFLREFQQGQHLASIKSLDLTYLETFDIYPPEADKY